MSEVLAKGVNFLYARQFIENEYGPEKWNAILRALPKGCHDVWSGGIMAHKSYPFSAFKEMTTALARESASLKKEQLARIYEFIADQSLNKVYKIFFSFTNPSFVIRNYPKLWANFFNSGKVEVPLAGKGHAVLKFTLPEIFLDWLSPACLGYSKKAVEMSGGRDLSINELSRNLVDQGTWEITFELRWTEGGKS